MTPQVFISYAEQDKKVADRIYDALKAGGVPCWAAHRDIAAGQKWPSEISKAISNSQVMIVVVSQHTQKSGYVEMEVTQAADEKLTIIPFCIENVSLSSGLRLLLSNCQKINTYPEPQDKGIERLVETLQRHLGIEPEKVLKKEERVEKPMVEISQSHLGIEPGKVLKKEEKLEKPHEVKKESPTKRNEANTKKSPRLKRVLIAASIIIAVVVVVFYISQQTHTPQTTPSENKTGIDKSGDTVPDVNKTKPAEEVSKNTSANSADLPDFISDLTSKGWDVKKNESDRWEAFYKAYDLTIIYIPAGKFLMGSNDGRDDEKPPHEVELDGYWIGKYEVTFSQYDRYCEETGKKKPNDRGWGRDKRPVINVSWDDAVAYCNWLSQKTGLTFQLPTEAQWEKAARGTKSLIYPWGNEFGKNKCNSAESGLDKTRPVGSYPSGKSPYGCMDMAGNVWEWCADWYDKDYYKNSPSKNPPGPLKGDYRVLRGGSWYNQSGDLRCAARGGNSPWFVWDDFGFRVVCVCAPSHTP